MFAACLAAVAYVKEPGTRLTAPWIPGTCGLVGVPLFPFLFLFLLLRATAVHSLLAGSLVGWGVGAVVKGVVF